METEKQHRDVAQKLANGSDFISVAFHCLWEVPKDAQSVWGTIDFWSRHLLQIEGDVSTALRTLQWLGNDRDSLFKLKICANPNCKTNRRYFFRENPNDRYCCDRCRDTAKEDRLMQRLISSGNYRKPKRSEEARDNMSRAALERWAHPEERERMAQTARARWARVRGGA